MASSESFSKAALNATQSRAPMPDAMDSLALAGRAQAASSSVMTSARRTLRDDDAAP